MRGKGSAVGVSRWNRGSVWPMIRAFALEGLVNPNVIRLQDMVLTSFLGKKKGIQ